MRFTVALPTDRVDALDEFVTPEAIAEVASAAERLGYGALYVTEHPIPDERWLASGGHHALDPFVALSFAAASTSRIRLLTNLCVVAYKSPYVTAKSAASLDRLSGGRLVLGVGAGYLEPEFRALGVDFARRNELCDEALAGMKRAWSGEPVSVEAPDGGVTRHRALPLPTQEPHPPIWMGGNSRRAIRRAVEHCQGWMPFPAPARMAARTRTAPLESVEDLAARIAYLREHAEAIGRSDPIDVAFITGLSGYYGQPGFELSRLLDDLSALADVGVTWGTALFEMTGTGFVKSRTHLLELLEGYATDVIAKLAP